MKNTGFLSFNYRNDIYKITFKLLNAKFSYPDSYKTMSRRIRRLGTIKNFNIGDVTNDSLITECPRVITHCGDRHFVTSHLRDRLMPAVVPVSNAPGSHAIPASGVFSVTGMRCGGSIK